jgi:hypothetical protein
MKAEMMENMNITRDVSKLLQDILKNQPPCKKIPIDSKLVPGFCQLTYLSIDEYCTCCSRNKSFIYSGNGLTGGVRDIGVYSNADTRYFSNGPGGGPFLGEYFRLSIVLRCATCNENHFFSLLYIDGNLIKLGQYPSFTTDSINDIRKYKNIISQCYNELVKSFNAYSQDMGVASFVYLRRIFERLIDEKYTGKSNKFIDKLNTVEKKHRIIPEEIKEIKGQLYAVLSKGVHEYQDDECLKLYPILKAVIILILDEELADKEKKRIASEAKKAIPQKLKQKIEIKRDISND